MALLSLSVQGVRRVQRRLRAINRRWTGRTATLARRELRKEFQRNLRREIDTRTRRRSGTLRRTARIRSPRVGVLNIVLFADFPGTSYSTPLGRGRRGASKIGQYAFVVNHRRHFIQAARDATLRAAPSIIRRAASRAAAEIRSSTREI